MGETNFNDVKLWLSRAQENSERCFVCRRIAEANAKAGELRPLKISGVDMSAELQLTHLALCVGRGKP